MGVFLSPSISFANECYSSAGKRKLPNLTKVELQRTRRSLKKKGISAHFIISEKLEVLKGHFPDNKIFPGVLYAQMAANLIKRQELVFGESVYFSEVPKFNNKAMGTPGSRVVLDVQLGESKGKQKTWTVQVKDRDNEKVIFSEGELISSSIPKDFYKKSSATEDLASWESLYSPAESSAFLKHEKEIIFPIEVLKYQRPKDFSLIENPSLENLELLNHKVFTQVKIPKTHLLMENLDSSRSHLPITNFSELGAQVALLILKPSFTGKLPFDVLLRGVNKVSIHQAIHSDQSYFVVSEVVSAKYRKKMDALSVEFVSEMFDAQQNLVATATISGLILNKAEEQ